MPTRFIVMVAAACSLSVMAAAGYSQQSQPPATVIELMLSTMEPASTVIFTAQAEPPTNRAGWTAVAQAAETLAESGRQLTRAPLARPEPAWKEMADALTAESLRAAAAARKQDADGLVEVGDALYETCRACHTHFLGGAR
jgi:hypothetical protein